MNQTPSSSVAPSSAAAPPTAQMVHHLRQMVERSAARWKRLIFLEAFGLAVAAPLAYLWLVFLLDNLFHLPVWGRLLASLGFLVAVGYLAISLMRRWRQLHFTEDQVALAMERQSGGVQNRLINAIQIARNGAGEFSQALVEENYQRLQQIEIHQASQVRPALVRIGLAGLVIVVGLLFWGLQRDHFQNAATRIMLPFADVDPIYQTLLDVTPGDIEAAGDVTIHIRIKGKIPPNLTVLRNLKNEHDSETIPVPRDSRQAVYTFKAVDQSMTYAVRGGDFLSPYYRIDVPTPAALSQVRITYHFPAYTRLPDKTVQSAGGDLEALMGTTARLEFLFDHPADEALMRLWKLPPQSQPAGGDGGVQDIPLRQISSTAFAGEITFADVLSYQLQTRHGQRPPHASSRYALRVRADQDPNLELLGLARQTEANVDATLPLKINATDDYGLEKVGLFVRPAAPPSLAEQAASAPFPSEEVWKPVEIWPANGTLELARSYDLDVAALGAAEGEKIEVVLRGMDADPLKNGRWASSAIFAIVVGGEGASFQMLYEQIMQSEAELKALIASEQAAVENASAWIGKLDAGSGLRWDEQANLDALAAAMKAQAAAQEKLRLSAGRTARDMPPQAGVLRFSLGMLADTEMVRAIRILENVAARDNPQGKRAALADARLTQERTIRSLREILDEYVRFRQEWELANMVSFVKMLADRQATLRADSLRCASQPADKASAARQQAAGRRQTKLLTLCGLAQMAFTGLAERVRQPEPILADAFVTAASGLSAGALKSAMHEAAEHAAAGRWSAAAARQEPAAKALLAIHQQLRAAQIEAARLALAALKDQAASDLQAQRELQKLRAGNGDSGLDFDEKSLKLEEIIHMREIAAGKKGGETTSGSTDTYKLDESQLGKLAVNPNPGQQQQYDKLKLASTPGGFKSFPNQSDRQGNRVTPPIQEKFEDLVSNLLEEADQLQDQYDTYNLNAAFSVNEAGEISKQAGDLNSTAAAAATGNQKPPPNDVGGASRTGRQGARAHGAVVGDQGVNRRGRDKPQEGQDRVADQAGSIKEQHSDDEQKDASTGIGGKKVDADSTSFSTADAGKWTDDMADRLAKPQAVNKIVERQTDRLDPRVAERLRDLSSKQEQVIERIKAIRKELHNLYLPSDQLDELMAELNANLESLKERPSADVFRLQMQTLDKLRSAVRVLGQASSGFQASLPRDQAVKGRVLDEPARQTMPGYEEAVKHYYEMLSFPE